MTDEREPRGRKPIPPEEWIPEHPFDSSVYLTRVAQPTYEEGATDGQDGSTEASGEEE